MNNLLRKLFLVLGVMIGTATFAVAPAAADGNCDDVTASTGEVCEMCVAGGCYYWDCDDSGQSGRGC